MPRRSCSSTADGRRRTSGTRSRQRWRIAFISMRSTSAATAIPARRRAGAATPEPAPPAVGGFQGKPSGEYTSPARFAERWQELAGVTCPTLIVRGARSKVLPVEAAEKMITVLANARLVTIPGSGHNPHFDCAGAFLAAV